MIARLIVVSMLACGVTAKAYAVDESYYNASDIPRMQPYCKARLVPGGMPEGWEYWIAQIGENFKDLHHYCAALNYMNRYWSVRNAKDRGYLLSIAMNNLNYMVKAEKPDFVLRGELYSNRGEVFRLQGKLGQAVGDFRHAIELNPKLTRPYLQLISYYEGYKKRGEALEIAKTGLRHRPDSKALQRHYLELGGKKPFPEPIAAPVAEPVSPQTADAAPAPTPETGVTPSPANTDTNQTVPEAVIAPPPIGTPSNPFCRFCP
ncbi:MAG: hypothetical protein Q8K52_12410 [Thiobacillus sp.]|nr:hypothetical protein [Thiobacillus sp.]